MHHLDTQATTLRLQGANGSVETINTTPEHPFYVSQEVDGSKRPSPVGHEELNSHWVGAGHLVVGDKLKLADGHEGKVLNVTTFQKTQQMFNLTVQTAHTFYVGGQGWLVHNVACPDWVSRVPSPGGNLVIHPGKYSQSELDAASKLAAYGNQVELRAATGNGRLSDLVVNSRTYDVYTPETNNFINLLGKIAKKNSQAIGIVLDLRNIENIPYSEWSILTRVREMGAENIQDIVVIGRK